MNCIDCKHYKPIETITYYSIVDGKRKENDYYREDIHLAPPREPKEGEFKETAVKDGKCPILCNNLFFYDTVSVMPNFGCKFFEQK